MNSFWLSLVGLYRGPWRRAARLEFLELDQSGPRPDSYPYLYTTIYFIILNRRRSDDKNKKLS